MSLSLPILNDILVDEIEKIKIYINTIEENIKLINSRIENDNKKDIDKTSVIEYQECLIKEQKKTIDAIYQLYLTLNQNSYNNYNMFVTKDIFSNYLLQINTNLLTLDTKIKKEIDNNISYHNSILKNELESKILNSIKSTVEYEIQKYFENTQRLQDEKIIKLEEKINVLVNNNAKKEVAKPIIKPEKIEKVDENDGWQKSYSGRIRR